jgi:hypothetical protein
VVHVRTIREEQNCCSPGTSRGIIKESLAVHTGYSSFGHERKGHRIESTRRLFYPKGFAWLVCVCVCVNETKSPNVVSSSHFLGKLLDHWQDGRLQIQLTGIGGVDVDTDTVQGRLDGLLGTTVQHFIAD